MDQVNSIRKMIEQKRIATGSICKMRDEQREGRAKAGIDEKHWYEADNGYPTLRERRDVNRRMNDLIQDYTKTPADVWEGQMDGIYSVDGADWPDLDNVRHAKHGIREGMTALSDDSDSESQDESDTGSKEEGWDDPKPS